MFNNLSLVSLAFQTKYLLRGPGDFWGGLGEWFWNKYPASIFVPRKFMHETTAKKIRTLSVSPKKKYHAYTQKIS